MELPDQFPVIETLVQAIALGQAISDVLHFDRGWAERVFQGDPTLHYTGPATLNTELQSMWCNGHVTQNEKTRLLTKFIMYRLDR